MGVPLLLYIFGRDNIKSHDLWLRKILSKESGLSF